MTAPRRFPEFGEIVAKLNARARDVALRYAPNGYWHGTDWWACNPGRDDTRPNSFVVHTAGPRAGRWHDFVPKEGGDMLDLIQLALRCDRRAALDEARGFLGITAEETDAQRAVRERARREHEREQAERARELERDRERTRRYAHALWLEAEAEIAGTPVAAYLAGRGIGLDRLGRAPGAVRFHPAVRFNQVCDRTGEVFEGKGPCMVTVMHGPWRADGPPRVAGIHRTWLAQDARGRWRKAPLPRAKMMLGASSGGFIRLWSGWGVRGGKGAPLAEAGEGARLFVTEGIEDALSAAVLIGRAPGVYVVAAGSLDHMGAMVLPPQLRDVTIVADRDPGAQAQAALARAEARLASEGRTVRRWQDHRGHKDLNDALLAALGDEEGAAA